MTLPKEERCDAFAIANFRCGLRIESIPERALQYGCCDGWTTILAIEYGYSRMALEWFCDPPKKWRGVNELMELIEQFRREFDA